LLALKVSDRPNPVTRYPEIVDRKRPFRGCGKLAHDC
jgi:hypothetical protein